MANLTNNNHYDAIIIGGGIAGASVAYSLSKRKMKTLLLERREDVALEASGNPTGIIYPLLTKNKSIEGTFSLKSFRFVTKEIELIQNIFNELKDPTPSSGVFLLPKSDLEKERYFGSIAANSLGKEELEFIRDDFSQKEGFLFKTALAISPRHLTKTLLQLSRNFTDIAFFENYKNKSENQGITIATEKATFHSDYLFLCHANSFLEFPETSWIPIRKVRGQLLWLPLADELMALPYSYLFGDYLTKDVGHGCVLGASFDEYQLEEEKRDHESLSFLERAGLALPKLEHFFSHLTNDGVSKLRTRVSYRSQSQDRRPVFGPLPDFKDFSEHLPTLPSPSSKMIPIVPNIKNQYVLGALGSRGLTHSLFASEMIVRDALKEISLLDEKEYADFKPSRFLLRNWKRGSK